jgi:hypothetical protein
LSCVDQSSGKVTYSPQVWIHEDLAMMLYSSHREPEPLVGIDGGFVELAVLIVVVLVLLILMFTGIGELSLPVLIINGIVGLVLIFLTNLLISPPIPINIITILISALGGVVGWAIILILHLLGVAFV